MDALLRLRRHLCLRRMVRGFLRNPDDFLHPGSDLFQDRFIGAHVASAIWLLNQLIRRLPVPPPIDHSAS
jgi:hypothetical protein